MIFIFFPCYILNVENYMGQLQKHNFIILTCMSLICGRVLPVLTAYLNSSVSARHIH